jgi:dCTP deaminase
MLPGNFLPHDCVRGAMTPTAKRLMPNDLLEPTGPLADLGTKPGVLPRQRIRALIRRRMLQAAIDIEDSQLQPASLDLRLGTRAFRVPASFLPGKGKTVEEQLAELEVDEINLEHGAVLEKGTVYVVELLEYLNLPESVAALANPKSSTGRLDVFTRLIADNSEMFDSVPGGYQGKIYTEISPCSFSIRVRRGSKLNQIRFRRRNPNQSESAKFTLADRDLLEKHALSPLVDGDIAVRNGLILSVDLKGENPSNVVGYRAQKFTGVIDVDQVAEYDPRDFWEQVHVRNYKKLILDPNQFYILASRERIHIPPDWAAEMVPIDPMMGEFRVHYAGFFDPGFGFTENGRPGSRAVLEVRSHEVPFILEDGQAIGRLVYEPLAETPDILYGQTDTSNYQGQGLKLSKHFRV